MSTLVLAHPSHLSTTFRPPLRPYFSAATTTLSTPSTSSTVPAVPSPSTTSTTIPAETPPSTPPTHSLPPTPPSSPSSPQIPPCYILEKLHSLGLQLFNSSQNATCILRIVSSLSSLSSPHISQTDLFFWCHPIFMIPHSSTLASIFTHHSRVSPLPSPSLISNIAFKWSYLHHKPHKNKEKSRNTPVIITTPTVKDCTPLLSLHLASPSTFPELLFAMYTGSPTRWRRALERDGVNAQWDAERLRVVFPNSKRVDVGEDEESDDGDDEEEEEEDVVVDGDEDVDGDGDVDEDVDGDGEDEGL